MCRGEPTHEGWSLSNWQGKAFVRETGTTLSPEFQSGLESLTSQARSGHRPFYLTDVNLSLNGSGSSIEGVMGSVRIPLMRSGEVHTILVKVKINDPRAGGSMLATFPRGLRTRSGGVDLEGELDELFHDHSVPLLSARLRYRHSALPHDTACEITQTAELKVPVTRSIGEDYRLQPNDDGPSSVTRDDIDTRLIYHIATNQPPRVALRTLRAHFGRNVVDSGCRQYLNEVAAELKYQTRVLERLEMTNDEDIMYALRPTPRSLHSNASIATSMSTQSPTTVSTSGMLSKLSLSSGNASRSSIRRVKSPETFDRARQIWSELRRKKRGGDRTNRRPGRSYAADNGSEETLKEIRRLAISNKRSLGAETLQSIRHEKVMKENVAPWL